MRYSFLLMLIMISCVNRQHENDNKLNGSINQLKDSSNNKYDNKEVAFVPLFTDSNKLALKDSCDKLFTFHSFDDYIKTKRLTSITETFNSGFISTNKNRFLRFTNCDYFYWGFDNEYLRNQYDCDYGFVSYQGKTSNYHIVCIFYYTTCQNIIYAYSVTDDFKIIDKLDLAFWGCTVEPSDTIVFNGKKISYGNSYENANFVGLDTIVKSMKTYYSIQSVDKFNYVHEVGDSIEELFVIDKSGHFIRENIIKGKKDYVDKVWETL